MAKRQLQQYVTSGSGATVWNARRFDDGTAGTNLSSTNVNSDWVDVGDYTAIEIMVVATKTSTAGNLTWTVQVGYGDASGNLPASGATYDMLKVTGTAVEGTASVTTSATSTFFISLPRFAAKWLRINLAGGAMTSSAYYTVTAQVLAKQA